MPIFKKFEPVNHAPVNGEPPVYLTPEGISQYNSLLTQITSDAKREHFFAENRQVAAERKKIRTTSRRPDVTNQELREAQREVLNPSSELNQRQSNVIEWSDFFSQVVSLHLPKTWRGYISQALSSFSNSTRNKAAYIVKIAQLLESLEQVWGPHVAPYIYSHELHEFFNRQWDRQHLDDSAQFNTFLVTTLSSIPFEAELDGRLTEIAGVAILTHAEFKLSRKFSEQGFAASRIEVIKESLSGINLVLKKLREGEIARAATPNLKSLADLIEKLMLAIDCLKEQPADAGINDLIAKFNAAQDQFISAYNDCPSVAIKESLRKFCIELGSKIISANLLADLRRNYKLTEANLGAYYTPDAPGVLHDRARAIKVFRDFEAHGPDINPLDGTSNDRNKLLYTRFLYSPEDLLVQADKLDEALLWCANAEADLSKYSPEDQLKFSAAIDEQKKQLIDARKELAQEMWRVLKNLAHLAGQKRDHVNDGAANLDRVQHGLVNDVATNLIARLDVVFNDKGDLLLMHIDEKAELTDRQLRDISAEYNDKPILVKKGAQFILYGNKKAHGSDWKSTPIEDRERVSFFANVRFPDTKTISGKPVVIVLVRDSIVANNDPKAKAKAALFSAVDATGGHDFTKKVFTLKPESAQRFCEIRFDEEHLLRFLHYIEKRGSDDVKRDAKNRDFDLWRKLCKAQERAPVYAESLVEFAERRPDVAVADVPAEVPEPTAEAPTLIIPKAVASQPGQQPLGDLAALIPRTKPYAINFPGVNRFEFVRDSKLGTRLQELLALIKDALRLDESKLTLAKDRVYPVLIYLEEAEAILIEEKRKLSGFISWLTYGSDFVQHYQRIFAQEDKIIAELKKKTAKSLVQRLIATFKADEHALFSSATLKSYCEFVVGANGRPGNGDDQDKADLKKHTNFLGNFLARLAVTHVSQIPDSVVFDSKADNETGLYKRANSVKIDAIIHDAALCEKFLDSNSDQQKIRAVRTIVAIITANRSLSDRVFADSNGDASKTANAIADSNGDASKTAKAIAAIIAANKDAQNAQNAQNAQIDMSFEAVNLVNAGKLKDALIEDVKILFPDVRTAKEFLERIVAGHVVTGQAIVDINDEQIIVTRSVNGEIYKGYDADRGFAFRDCEKWLKLILQPNGVNLEEFFDSNNPDFDHYVRLTATKESREPSQIIETVTWLVNSSDPGRIKRIKELLVNIIDDIKGLNDPRLPYLEQFIVHSKPLPDNDVLAKYRMMMLGFYYKNERNDRFERVDVAIYQNQSPIHPGLICRHKLFHEFSCEYSSAQLKALDTYTSHELNIEDCSLVRLTRLVIERESCYSFRDAKLRQLHFETVYQFLDYSTKVTDFDTHFGLLPLAPEPLLAASERLMSAISGINLDKTYDEVQEERLRRLVSVKSDTFEFNEQRIFDIYVLQAECWLSGKEFTNPQTGEVLNKDELNRSLELIEKFCLGTDKKDKDVTPKDFRESIVSYVKNYRADNEGQSPQWTDHLVMRKAIQAKLLATVLVDKCVYSEEWEGRKIKSAPQIILAMTKPGIDAVRAYFPVALQKEVAFTALIYLLRHPHLSNDAGVALDFVAELLTSSTHELSQDQTVFTHRTQGDKVVKSGGRVEVMVPLKPKQISINGRKVTLQKEVYAEEVSALIQAIKSRNILPNIHGEIIIDDKTFAHMWRVLQLLVLPLKDVITQGSDKELSKQELDAVAAELTKDAKEIVGEYCFAYIQALFAQKEVQKLDISRNDLHIFRIVHDTCFSATQKEVIAKLCELYRYNSNAITQELILKLGSTPQFTIVSNQQKHASAHGLIAEALKNIVEGKAYNQEDFRNTFGKDIAQSGTDYRDAFFGAAFEIIIDELEGKPTVAGVTQLIKLKNFIWGEIESGKEKWLDLFLEERLGREASHQYELNFKEKLCAFVLKANHSKILASLGNEQAEKAYLRFVEDVVVSVTTEKAAEIKKYIKKLEDVRVKASPDDRKAIDLVLAEQKRRLVAFEGKPEKDGEEHKKSIPEQSRENVREHLMLYIFGLQGDCIPEKREKSLLQVVPRNDLDTVKRLIRSGFYAECFPRVKEHAGFDEEFSTALTQRFNRILTLNPHYCLASDKSSNKDGATPVVNNVPTDLSKTVALGRIVSLVTVLDAAQDAPTVFTTLNASVCERIKGLLSANKFNEAFEFISTILLHINAWDTQLKANVESVLQKYILNTLLVYILDVNNSESAIDERLQAFLLPLVNIEIPLAADEQYRKKVDIFQKAVINALNLEIVTKIENIDGSNNNLNIDRAVDVAFTIATVAQDKFNTQADNNPAHRFGNALLSCAERYSAENKPLLVAEAMEKAKQKVVIRGYDTELSWLDQLLYIVAGIFRNERIAKTSQIQDSKTEEKTQQKIKQEKRKDSTRTFSQIIESYRFVDRTKKIADADIQKLGIPVREYVVKVKTNGEILYDSLLTSEAVNIFPALGKILLNEEVKRRFIVFYNRADKTLPPIARLNNALGWITKNNAFVTEMDVRHAVAQYLFGDTLALNNDRGPEFTIQVPAKVTPGVRDAKNNLITPEVVIPEFVNVAGWTPKKAKEYVEEETGRQVVNPETTYSAMLTESKNVVTEVTYTLERLAAVEIEPAVFMSLLSDIEKGLVQVSKPIPAGAKDDKKLTGLEKYAQFIANPELDNRRGLKRILEIPGIKQALVAYWNVNDHEPPTFIAIDERLSRSTIVINGIVTAKNDPVTDPLGELFLGDFQGFRPYKNQIISILNQADTRLIGDCKLAHILRDLKISKCQPLVHLLEKRPIADVLVDYLNSRDLPEYTILLEKLDAVAAENEVIPVIGDNRKLTKEEQQELVKKMSGDFITERAAVKQRARESFDATKGVIIATLLSGDAGKQAKLTEIFQEQEGYGVITNITTREILGWTRYLQYVAGLDACNDQAVISAEDKTKILEILRRDDVKARAVDYWSIHARPEEYSKVELWDNMPIMKDLVLDDVKASYNRYINAVRDTLPNFKVMQDLLNVPALRDLLEQHLLMIGLTKAENPKFGFIAALHKLNAALTSPEIKGLDAAIPVIEEILFTYAGALKGIRNDNAFTSAVTAYVALPRRERSSSQSPIPPDSPSRTSEEGTVVNVASHAIEFNVHMFEKTRMESFDGSNSVWQEERPFLYDKFLRSSAFKALINDYYANPGHKAKTVNDLVALDKYLGHFSTLAEIPVLLNDFFFPGYELKYNLILLNVDETKGTTEEALSDVSAKNNHLPILVKKGNKFYIYGNKEVSKWGIISVKDSDVKECEFDKFNFPTYGQTTVVELTDAQHSKMSSLHAHKVSIFTTIQHDDRELCKIANESYYGTFVREILPTLSIDAEIKKLFDLDVVRAKFILVLAEVKNVIGTVIQPNIILRNISKEPSQLTQLIEKYRAVLINEAAYYDFISKLDSYSFPHLKAIFLDATVKECVKGIVENSRDNKIGYNQILSNIEKYAAALTSYTVELNAEFDVAKLKERMLSALQSTLEVGKLEIVLKAILTSSTPNTYRDLLNALLSHPDLGEENKALIKLIWKSQSLENEYNINLKVLGHDGFIKSFVRTVKYEAFLNQLRNSSRDFKYLLSFSDIENAVKSERIVNFYDGVDKLNRVTRHAPPSSDVRARFNSSVVPLEAKPVSQAMPENQQHINFFEDFMKALSGAHKSHLTRFPSEHKRELLAGALWQLLEGKASPTVLREDVLRQDELVNNALGEARFIALASKLQAKYPALVKILHSVFIREQLEEHFAHNLPPADLTAFINAMSQADNIIAICQAIDMHLLGNKESLKKSIGEYEDALISVDRVNQAIGEARYDLFINQAGFANRPELKHLMESKKQELIHFWILNGTPNTQVNFTELDQTIISTNAANLISVLDKLLLKTVDHKKSPLFNINFLAENLKAEAIYQQLLASFAAEFNDSPIYILLGTDWVSVALQAYIREHLGEYTNVSRAFENIKVSLATALGSVKITAESEDKALPIIMSAIVKALWNGNDVAPNATLKIPFARHLLGHARLLHFVNKDEIKNRPVLRKVLLMPAIRKLLLERWGLQPNLNSDFPVPEKIATLVKVPDGTRRDLDECLAASDAADIVAFKAVLADAFFENENALSMVQDFSADDAKPLIAEARYWVVRSQNAAYSQEDNSVTLQSYFIDNKLPEKNLYGSQMGNARYVEFSKREEIQSWIGLSDVIKLFEIQLKHFWNNKKPKFVSQDFARMLLDPATNMSNIKDQLANTLFGSEDSVEKRHVIDAPRGELKVDESLFKKLKAGAKYYQYEQSLRNSITPNNALLAIVKMVSVKAVLQDVWKEIQSPTALFDFYKDLIAKNPITDAEAIKKALCRHFSVIEGTFDVVDLDPLKLLVGEARYAVFMHCAEVAGHKELVMGLKHPSNNDFVKSLLKDVADDYLVAALQNSKDALINYWKSHSLPESLAGLFENITSDKDLQQIPGLVKAVELALDLENVRAKQLRDRVDFSALLAKEATCIEAITVEANRNVLNAMVDIQANSKDDADSKDDAEKLLVGETCYALFMQRVEVVGHKELIIRLKQANNNDPVRALLAGVADDYLVTALQASKEKLINYWKSHSLPENLAGLFADITSDKDLKQIPGLVKAVERALELEKIRVSLLPDEAAVRDEAAEFKARLVREAEYIRTKYVQANRNALNAIVDVKTSSAPADKDFEAYTSSYKGEVSTKLALVKQQGDLAAVETMQKHNAYFDLLDIKYSDFDRLVWGAKEKLIALSKEVNGIDADVQLLESINHEEPLAVEQIVGLIALINELSTTEQAENYAQLLAPFKQLFRIFDMIGWWFEVSNTKENSRWTINTLQEKLTALHVKAFYAYSQNREMKEVMRPIYLEQIDVVLNDSIRSVVQLYKERVAILAQLDEALASSKNTDDVATIDSLTRFAATKEGEIVVGLKQIVVTLDEALANNGSKQRFIAPVVEMLDSLWKKKSASESRSKYRNRVSIGIAFLQQITESKSWELAIACSDCEMPKNPATPEEFALRDRLASLSKEIALRDRVLKLAEGIGRDCISRKNIDLFIRIFKSIYEKSPNSKVKDRLGKQLIECLKVSLIDLRIKDVIKLLELSSGLRKQELGGFEQTIRDVFAILHYHHIKLDASGYLHPILRSKFYEVFGRKPIDAILYGNLATLVGEVNEELKNELINCSNGGAIIAGYSDPTKATQANQLHEDMLYSMTHAEHVAFLTTLNSKLTDLTAYEALEFYGKFAPAVESGVCKWILQNSTEQEFKNIKVNLPLLKLKTAAIAINNVSVESSKSTVTTKPSDRELVDTLRFNCLPIIISDGSDDCKALAEKYWKTICPSDKWDVIKATAALPQSREKAYSTTFGIVSTLHSESSSGYSSPNSPGRLSRSASVTSVASLLNTPTKVPSTPQKVVPASPAVARREDSDLYLGASAKTPSSADRGSLLSSQKISQQLAAAAAASSPAVDPMLSSVAASPFIPAAASPLKQPSSSALKSFNFKASADGLCMWYSYAIIVAKNAADFVASGKDPGHPLESVLRKIYHLWNVGKTPLFGKAPTFDEFCDDFAKKYKAGEVKEIEKLFKCIKNYVYSELKDENPSLQTLKDSNTQSVARRIYALFHAQVARIKNAKSTETVSGLISAMDLSSILIKDKNFYYDLFPLEKEITAKFAELLRKYFGSDKATDDPARLGEVMGQLQEWCSGMSQTYYEKLQSASAWAGQLELEALSRLLNIGIKVSESLRSDNFDDVSIRVEWYIKFSESIDGAEHAIGHYDPVLELSGMRKAGSSLAVTSVPGSNSTYGAPTLTINMDA